MPLNRRSRLKPGKPLQRRTPVAEVGRKAVKASKKTRPKNTGPDRTTRDLVKQRDDWRCAVCGESVYDRQASVHHRRNRASGGSSDPAVNRPSNLLLVCGTGSTGCHGDLTDNRQRDVALDAGWIVSTNSSDEPIQVPVHHALFGLVVLDDEGGWSPVPHVNGGLDLSRRETQVAPDLTDGSH